MSFVSANFKSISYTELPHCPISSSPAAVAAFRFRYQGFYWSVYNWISLLATEEPSKV